MASSPREVKTSGAFVYFSFLRSHTCQTAFGIEYKGVSEAASYNFRYLQHPYGIQNMNNEVPTPAQDKLLGYGKVQHAKGEHFLLLGGGGVAMGAGSTCQPGKDPYSASYSKVSIEAVLG